MSLVVVIGSFLGPAHAVGCPGRPDSVAPGVDEDRGRVDLGGAGLCLRVDGLSMEEEP